MSPRLRNALLVMAAVQAAVIALGILVLSGKKESTYAEAAVVGIVAGSVLLLGTAGLTSALRAHFREEFRISVLQVLGVAARRGRPLAGALEAIALDHAGGLHRRTLRVLARLGEGLSLGEALDGGAPGLFSPGEIEAIRATEGTARLGDALDGLASQAMARRRTTENLLLSLAYPLVIFSISFAIAHSVVGAYGNALSRSRDREGVPFDGDPVIVGFLGMRMSSGEYLAGALLLLVLGAVAVLLFRGVAGRRLRFLRGLVARLPGIGTSAALEAAEMLCRTMGPLVQAGLPLDRALSSAAPAVEDRRLRRSVHRAAAAAAHGEGAAAVFSLLDLPKWVRGRMMAAASGTPERFAGALDALADECTTRRRRRADALVGTVYPVTLLGGSALAYFLFKSVIGSYYALILGRVIR